MFLVLSLSSQQDQDTTQHRTKYITHHYIKSIWQLKYNMQHVTFEQEGKIRNLVEVLCTLVVKLLNWPNSIMQNTTLLSVTFSKHDVKDMDKIVHERKLMYFDFSFFYLLMNCKNFIDESSFYYLFPIVKINVICFPSFPKM